MNNFMAVEDHLQLYDIFLHAPSCIVVMKGPDHIFEMANAPYLTLINKHDIIGKTVQQVMPEVEEQGFIKLLDDVFNTGISFHANEMLVKLDIDGTGVMADVYLNFIYQPYRDKEGKISGVLCFGVDVTEQVLLRKAVEENEKRFRLIYNTVTDIIFMLDVVKKNRYKIVSVNQSFIKITGLDEKYVLNKYVENILPASSVSNILEKCRTVTTTLEPLSWEDSITYNSFSKSGIITMVPVINEANECIKLVVSIKDITQQKDEQRQLKLLESIVSKSIDAVMITDANILSGEELKILYINDAFTKLTGYKSEEVIGRSPRMLHGELTDKRKMDRLSNCLKKFQPCEDDFVNYKKNGKAYWVHFSSFPIENEKGGFTHFISFQKDITKRKKEEIEKEHLIDELTKSNKELKQFSYITSHNLRGPLTNLVAIGNLIDTTLINDPGTKELVEGFKISTFKLNQTLNDLIKILIIKETSKQAFTKVCFQDTCSAVQVSLAALIELSGMYIITDFSAVSKVNFNSVYMESIFMNLITNAIKYHHPDRSPKLNIYTRCHENITQLIFEDNGCGLDLEKVGDRMFGLYQRFHDHTEGTGLGLYLTHAQITSAGGSIKVESAPNQGTKFIITFK